MDHFQSKSFRNEGKPAVTTSANALPEFGVSNLRERRTVRRSSRHEAVILEMHTHEEPCGQAKKARSMMRDAG